MFRLLKAERMKLKRSPVWLAFLIMPIVPALLGTLNYMGNIEILTSGWYSLWTQHTLFTDYFFLPVMIGIYCAYIMRLEHNNHNWNKMLTIPQSRTAVLLSKLITASFMVFISELWIGILFVISGFAVGLTNPPYVQIAVWCLCGTLGGMVIAAIQLMLSFFIKSFALPVGISFAGGLSGILFLAKHLGHIYPYSLMAYGMNSNSPQKLMESGYGSFISVCVVYIALFVVISSMIFNRRNI